MTRPRPRPTRYWKIFVDRLDAAGKIDLAVKWLPFNDRTKVGHDIYERMLISTIDHGDCLTLLVRKPRHHIAESTGSNVV